MHFALAFAIAVSFWAPRNAPVPCQAHAISGSYADQILPKDQWGNPAGMGAVPSSCTIYVSSDVSAWRYDRDMNIVYCLMVAHEVGHLVGRSHSDDPDSIMNANPPDSATPWDCVHWRSYAKRHHIPIWR